MGSLSFAKLWLWPFLAAAAIPWLLYLFDRYRAQRVEWPALKFFLAKGRKQLRWLEWRELALLATRTSIIAVLVLSLMQPSLNERSEIESEGPFVSDTMLVSIVIDTSFSMSHRTSGVSTLDNAKIAAKRLVEGLPSSTRVTWWHANAIQEINAPRLLEELDLLQATPGSFRVDEVIDAHTVFLGDQASERRLIVIFSDLQRASEREADGRWSLLARRLREVGGETEVLIVDCAATTRENPNVIEFSAPQRATGLGETVRWTLSVASRESVGAKVFEGSNQIHEQTLTPAADGIARGEFDYRIDRTGDHELKLRIDDPALTVDNERFAVLRVRDRLDVTIVDTSGEQAIEDALWPRLSGRPPPNTILRPRSIDAFTSSHHDNTSVLILTELRGLEQPEVEAIDAFVSRGGGLIILCGERTDLDLAASLFREGHGPAPLLPTERRDKNGLTWRVTSVDSQHAVWLPFRTDTDGDPRLLQFRSLWESRLSPAATSIARLGEEHSWIALKSYGSGHCAMLTTGVNDGDLFQTPLAPPLFHELVKAVCEAPKTEFSIDGQEVQLEEQNSARTLVLPDGQFVALGNDGKFTPELIPGHYSLGERSLAFNVDARESNLERVDEQSLLLWKNDLGAKIEPLAKLFAPRTHQTKVAKPVWIHLLVTALVLFLIELSLMHRFAAKRRNA